MSIRPSVNGGGSGGGAASSTASWQPTDSGLLSWTVDPVYATVAAAPASGVVNLFAMRVRAAAISQGIIMAQAAAGTIMTSGQNFLALYNSAGVQVAITADLSTIFATANQLVNPNWVVPPALTAGFYWGCLLVNSTGTIPTFRTTMSSSTSYNLSVAANLTPATYRYAVNGTGTVPPASFTPASNLSSFGWWAALR